MDRADIIIKVQARLDEISEFASGETVYNHQVDKELDDSAVELVSLLPAHIAYPIEPGDDPSISDGYILCPSDFVKIATLKMSNWDIRVTHCVSPGDIRESYQLYDYLASDKRLPVAVLYNTDTGAYKIRVFPAGGTIDVFSYVQRPPNAQALNDNLIDIFTWLCASRVYRVHGEADMSVLCMEKFGQMVQAKTMK